MTCYHPRLACYSKSEYAKTGKKHLHLDMLQSDTKEAAILNNGHYPKTLYEWIKLPCGCCVGCRSDKAREWSLRAMHECKLHNDNCFITLTYDNLSPLVQEDPNCLRSLVYRHFQLFMKRLRKEYKNDKIGFMVSGEYGPKDGRAHWHAILFGFDFPDKELVYVKDGYRHYSSPTLNRLWSTYDRKTDSFIPIGFTDLANCDDDCCRYVSQYVLKKLPVGSNNDEMTIVKSPTGELQFWQNEDYKDRVSPFVRTSRRPAIGLGWFEKYGDQSVRNGFVSVLNKKDNSSRRVKTPKYYFDKFEKNNPEEFLSLKREREEKMREYYRVADISKSLLSTWEESHLYRIATKLKEKLTKFS